VIVIRFLLESIQASDAASIRDKTGMFAGFLAAVAPAGPKHYARDGPASERSVFRVHSSDTSGRAENAPTTLKIDPEKIARTYDEDTAHWLSALANTHDPQGVLAVGQVMRRIS